LRSNFRHQRGTERSDISRGVSKVRSLLALRVKGRGEGGKRSNSRSPFVAKKGEGGAEKKKRSRVYRGESANAFIHRGVWREEEKREKKEVGKDLVARLKGRFGPWQG